MRSYDNSRQFYAGIDLHARQMCVCVVDSEGQTKLHRNMPSDRSASSVDPWYVLYWTVRIPGSSFCLFNCFEVL
jgi:hypothetical protein